MSQHVSRSRGELTGVDQLLLGHFPALVALDLGLEFANLRHELESCDAWQRRGCSAYRFRWLGLDDELVLLEVLRSGQLWLRSGRKCSKGDTLNVIFILAVAACVVEDGAVSGGVLMFKMR